jgi:hypothetical protein
VPSWASRSSSALVWLSTTSQASTVSPRGRNRLASQHGKIPRMADFGELPFLSAAVQVIPVLGVLVVADSFLQRDVQDKVHRTYASAAVAIGLVWGIAGEIAGLQALLTGPTRQTIPLVSGGLIALAATALGPRLVELIVSLYPDAARRITQRMLPAIIGIVGLVVSTSRAPLGYRVPLYAFVGVYLSLVVVSFWVQPLRGQAAPRRSASAGSDGQDDRPARPAVQPPATAPNRPPRWWVVASVVGLAVALRMGRRRRDRRRGP